MSSVQERVDKGVQLLDFKCPGWRKKVYASKLDMSDILNCVLGQIFGYYYDGLNELELSDNPEELCDSPRHFGFNASSGDEAEYLELKREWTKRLMDVA